MIAKYDYQAQDSQELDIKKNEKLLLLDDSKHWWKVQNNNKQAGFVPSNYVKRAKTSIFSSLKNTLHRKRGSESKIQVQQVKNGDCSEQNSIGSENTPCDNFAAFAKWPYQSQQTDELSLNKADHVIVMEKSSDGWWKGRKDTGEVGWFPSNYVQPLNDEASDVSTYADPAGPTPNDSVSQDCLEVVIALYAFISTNSEELSFEKDERLEVVEKPETDPEWWKARNERGEIGLVPKTYVQVTSLDSVAFSQSTSQSNSSSLSGHSREVPNSGSTSVYRRGFHIAGPLEDKDWYYGNISRSECDKVMNDFADNGDFLIRDSETNVSFF